MIKRTHLQSFLSEKTHLERVFYITKWGDILDKIYSKNKMNEIADEIVDDIISQRNGQMYDDEILDYFVNCKFESSMEKVKKLVDEKMRKYLENDNLIIRSDAL